MVWDLLNWVFGIMCIAGPLCLVGWYYGAAKKQFRDLGKPK